MQGKVIMGDILLWLGKALLSQAEKRAVDRFFSKDLVNRIRERVNEWQGSLPQDESLVPEALFSPSSNNSNNLPPAPTAIVELLKSGSIPSAEDWLQSLFEQWKWVKSNIEEPQAFFTLSEDRAEQHLRVLSDAIHSECAKDVERFRLDTHKRLVGTENNQAEVLARLEGIENHLGIGAQPPSESLRDETEESPFSCEIDSANQQLKDLNPDAAIRELQSLKNNKWDELSDHEKYRVEANLGIAFQAKEDYDTSAQHFIDCCQYRPDHEDARCYQIAGYLTHGDTETAKKLLIKVLVDFPTSDFALALRVRSAEKSLSFADIELLVHSDHQCGPELAMALSRRALEHKLMDQAERYARISSKDSQNVSMTDSHLGAVLIESAHQTIAALLSETPRLGDGARQKVKEGMGLLSRSLEAYQRLNIPRSISICKYYLSRGHYLLGDQEQADSLLQQAHSLFTDDVDYAVQYAVSLFEQNRLDKAIDVLRPVASSDPSFSTTILLSQCLRQRRHGKDINEAIDVLESQLESFPGTKPSANTEFLDELIKLYCQNDRATDALKLLDSHASQLGLFEQHVLTSAVMRRSDDENGAKDAIRQAVELHDENTHHWHRHLLIRELICLEEYRSAFDILRQSIPSSCVTIDTDGFLICAQRCGEDAFLIEFLGSLRNAGYVRTAFLDLELSLLEQYHVGETCIAIAEEVLASTDDDRLSAEMRVRLSFLGVVYERSDLVTADLSLLPSPIEASSKLGFHVSQLLSHEKRHGKSQAYAYTLLRSNFDSSWAHKALILSYLFDRRENPSTGPDEVAIGSAVHYRDEASKETKWLIIEDEPDPDISRNEYAPDHHIVKELLGKKAGEEFYIRKDSFQDKRGTILKLEHKGVRRFNECLQEWETRFDEFFMQDMTMPRDDQGELDISPLLEFADRRAEETKRRDDIYRTYPLSTSSYARLVQMDIFDAISHLAAKKLPIRCCLGNQEEHDAAQSLLTEHATIVIDSTALATLFFSKNYKHLEALPHQILVSRGTLIGLQATLEDTWRFGDEEVTPRDEGSIIVTVSPEEPSDTWKGRMTELIAAVKKHAEIVDGMPLAIMSPDLRNELTALFGRQVAESIAIANARNAVLWTDDLFVAQVAAERCGIRRVWTELMFSLVCGRGNYTDDDMYQLLKSLIEHGYRHCRLTPPVAYRIGEESNWDFRNEPLASVLDWLATPNILSAGVLEIAEHILPRVYYGADDVIANPTVLSILGKIGSRPDGRKLVNNLRRRVGIFCRGDFFIEDRLSQDIDVWLRTNTQLSLAAQHKA